LRYIFIFFNLVSFSLFAKLQNGSNDSLKKLILPALKKHLETT